MRQSAQGEKYVVINGWLGDESMYVWMIKLIRVVI